MSVESLEVFQGSSFSAAVLIFSFQPLGVRQQFGYFVPDSFLQKLALDLRIATDAFAAKPIAIRSTAAVIPKVFHLTASPHLTGSLAVVSVTASRAASESLVDIGGGTTDVALISMSGIVYARSLRVAGNHMDEAIMNYMKRKYNLLIGERMAEQIKIEVGSASTLEKPMTMEVKGRSLLEGMPKAITVDDSEIREALNECLVAIVNAVHVALERTPPELSADISDRGLVLAGGGALLKNLDKRIRDETGLPVCVPDDPSYSVVLGTAKLLDDFKLLCRVAVD